MCIFSFYPGRRLVSSITRTFVPELLTKDDMDQMVGGGGGGLLYFCIIGVVVKRIEWGGGYSHI